MKKTILLIIIASIVISGCTEILSEDELKQKIINANTNMESYTAEIQMTMNIKTSVMGNKININTITNSKGDIDRKNKKAKIKSSTESKEIGLNTQTESYIDNNFVYVKSSDVWVKMNLEDDLWTRQDQVEQVTTLMQTGTIMRLNDEKKDGKAYYLVKITPDLKKMFEVSLKQENFFAKYEKMNYEDMVKSYSMTIWVNKDTHIIERTRIEMTLLITSENIGEDDPEKVMESNIALNSIIDVTISNINKDLDIVIPSEALNAIDFTQMLKDQSTPIITDNTANVI